MEPIYSLLVQLTYEKSSMEREQSYEQMRWACILAASIDLGTVSERNGSFDRYCGLFDDYMAQSLVRLC